MTPASVRVVVGEKDIQSINPDSILIEMRIKHEVNQHSTCFLEYRQTPDKPFDLTDYHGLYLEVFVQLSDGTEFSVFCGTVQGATHRHFTSGAFHLQLLGTGNTMDLDHQNRFFTYKQPNFTDKIKTITDRAVEVDPAVVVNDQTALDSFLPRSYQLGETDWLHLLAEASDAGLMLVPDGTKLFALDHFQPSPTTLKWREEGGLIEFQVSTRFIPANRRGVNYDREDFKSKIFEKIQDDPKRLGAVPNICDNTKKMNVSDLIQGAKPEVTMQPESSAEADLKMDSRRALAQSVRGIGTSREAALLLGRTVDIQSGAEFSGKWGIIRLVHMWTQTGYMNEFECTPFDSGICVPQVELPRVPWSFRARVKSAPVRETGRIQIQFPWEDGDESLFWPWITPHAGADRGFCYPPEVGDEVLVQFHNGDAAEPFILGSAWNGKELPPLEDLHGNEFNNNDIKRIVTKSGNRMVMDDKQGKETIVVATPKHVRVSLFDGGSTLVLHSDGDIHINAGGTIHMKCHQFLRQVG